MSRHFRHNKKEPYLSTSIPWESASSSAPSQLHFIRHVTSFLFREIIWKAMESPLLSVESGKSVYGERWRRSLGCKFSHTLSTHLGPPPPFLISQLRLLPRRKGGKIGFFVEMGSIPSEEEEEDDADAAAPIGSPPQNDDLRYGTPEEPAAANIFPVQRRRSEIREGP